MKPVQYALLLSAAILLGAFYPNHSYNYFVFLKWVVTVSAIWGAINAHENARQITTFILAFAAILHNPILKFSFERETWLVLDGVTVVLFLILAASIKPLKRSNNAR